MENNILTFYQPNPQSGIKTTVPTDSHTRKHSMPTATQAHAQGHAECEPLYRGDDGHTQVTPVTNHVTLSFYLDILDQPVQIFFRSSWGEWKHESYSCYHNLFQVLGSTHEQCFWNKKQTLKLHTLQSSPNFIFPFIYSNQLQLLPLHFLTLSYDL